MAAIDHAIAALPESRRAGCPRWHRNDCRLLHLGAAMPTMTVSASTACGFRRGLG